ncbi:uncharacterized protein LOC127534054 [Xyrichtys novacula]|uniref:DNA-directed DNA polymerase n=1 Tax=Xyrichtys novacula TaxID=13765 RepID=A0AAV1G2T8_XYRNO|nr:uncharacterized protein LOC127534054 [Xyrichtys novacula]
MNREFDSESLSRSTQVPLEIELAVEQLRHIPTPSSKHQVPLDLQIAVDQLRYIPVANNVDAQNSSPSEPQNPFQTLEDTVQRLNQTGEDVFRDIENSLQNLNQTNTSALNLLNESENESQPQTQPQTQRGEGSGQRHHHAEEQEEEGGEGLRQRHRPTEEQEEERVSGGRESEATSYDRFNTLVMRRSFTVPRPGNVPDIAAFYRNVIGVIRELANEVESRASRDDVIQLEVVGENVRDYVSVTNNAQGRNILPAFEGLLDRIVQSNNSVAGDEDIELIVQIVRNPTGGAKRKMEKTLDCEPLSHFATDFPDHSKPLFLFLLQNHYYGIKNLKAFMGTKYVCNYFYKSFNNPIVHSCEGYCQVCTDPICTTEELKPLKCTDCHRTCRSLSCFARHKEAKPSPMNKQPFSFCDQIKKCKLCKLSHYVNMTTGKASHHCNTTRCRICGETLPFGSETDAHLCYIQPVAGETKELGLVFYDFETFVNENNEHIPFLVYAKTLKGEEKVFYGLDCVKRFLLYFRRNRHRRNVFIAHNARGFDSYLVLKGILKERASPQNILMTGCKILSFEEPDYQLKFIDSLFFLPMRLSAMPKALGFSDQSKGYFPHRFSSEKHLEYVGPYPPPSYYGVDRMTACEQEVFYRWYNEKSQDVFDFGKKPCITVRTTSKFSPQDALNSGNSISMRRVWTLSALLP